MKSIFYKYYSAPVVAFLMMTIIAIGCKKTENVAINVDTVDLSKVDSISLKKESNFILADGKAENILTPQLFIKSQLIPAARITNDMIVFKDGQGAVLQNPIKISDATMAGKKITITAQLKDKPALTDTAQINILAPQGNDGSVITIPIVFHLLDTKYDQIIRGKISYQLFQNVLDKINRSFEGSLVNAPTGVNTKVQFRFALYAPNGAKLTEPGLNRIDVDTLKYASLSPEDTITNRNLAWDYTKYMNVWLFSNEAKLGVFANFDYTYSRNCVPRYIYSGITPIAGDASLKVLTTATVLKPSDYGIIMRLQDIFVVKQSFATSERDMLFELNYVLGRYLGLKPTWNAAPPNAIKNDYVTDTQKYPLIVGATNAQNNGLYKIYGKAWFLPNNIMDDPTGFHKSITKDQNTRIHWYLTNSPVRAFWKSDFAFKGQ